MKKFEGILHTRSGVWICIGGVFLLMLLLNCLTPYVADDFVYRLSFATKEPLEGLGDVARSMYVHCYRMNGRVVSHSLEQLFMLGPKLMFNLCNAAVYTGLMYLLYRAANFGKKPSPMLFLAMAAAFWYFMPVFGQVALWQVGSLNYLWGLAAGMCFLLPYLRCYVGRWTPGIGWKILFSGAALLVGMYTEVTSFIVIFLAALLLIISAVSGRTGWKTWLWIPLAIACVGYGLMLSMPAEMNAKQGSLDLATLMENFANATELLRSNLLWLILAWAVCFVLAAWGKVQRERLVLSGVFTLGAAAANYMLIVAAYYPERCMCTSCMLLILACGVLLPELKCGGLGAFRACAGAALTVVFLFSLVTGCYDVLQSYTGFTAREQVIVQAAAEGQEDLILQCVHAQSKYSAFWGTTDLNTETADTWPNNQMAEYYGVRSILGY